MSQVVIINVGVSGSGKSTWTTAYIKKNPKSLRLNRDSLRIHFYGTLEGYYEDKSLREREDFITSVEESLFIAALVRGWSVIIDNTNLTQGYIERWLKVVELYNEGHEKVGIKFKLFPMEDADALKKRVSNRDGLSLLRLNYIDKQIASIRTVVGYVERNHKDLIFND